MTKLIIDKKSTTHGVQLTDKTEIQLYVYGGKGRFTLKSKTSNKEFEYVIKPMSKYHAKFDEYTFYVSLKVNGVNNFLGVLKAETDTYIHSRKSFYTYNSDEVKGIRWLIKLFGTDKEFPEGMEFRHMGICSCCARTLTTPASIKSGIGPVCFEKYGNKRLKKLMKLKKIIMQKMKQKNKS